MRNIITMESMPKQLLRTTGARVRLLRETEGWNQSQLAAEVTRRGVSVSNFQISAIERGTSAPSWEVAVAKRRADTAYVDGNLDPDDYGAQVRRLRSQQATAEAEITRLEQLAADLAQRATRRKRVEEFAADGLARLDDPDTAAANMWLREHLRLWVVRDGVSVEWL